MTDPLPTRSAPVPDAAVEAAAVALSAFRTMPGPNMERDARAALAAALPHLIDPETVEFDARVALPEAQERFQRAEAEVDRLREGLRAVRGIVPWGRTDVNRMIDALLEVDPCPRAPR